MRHKFAKYKILEILKLLQKIESFNLKCLNFLRRFKKKLLKKLRSFDGNFLFFEVVKTFDKVSLPLSGKSPYNIKTAKNLLK